MDDAVDEPLLGTSTLRGILLLGGVVAVAFVAYEFWYKQRLIDITTPHKKLPIRIPIALPVIKK